MKVHVIRQACCAADDQLGPLEAEYIIEDNSPLPHLIEQIQASRFLQFSSTHDRISGEVDGRLLVDVHAPGGPPPAFHVGASESVRTAVGEHTLYFRFRHA